MLCDQFFFVIMFLGEDNIVKEEKMEENNEDLSMKYFNTLKFFEKEQRPDYFNFRNLLWTAMTYFPKLAEKKSRDIVPLLFEYLE